MRKKIRRLLCALLLLALTAGAAPSLRLCVTANAVDTGEVLEKLEQFKALYPPGGYWYDSFHGSNQCKGFARMAVYHLFGTTRAGAYRQWTYSGANSAGMVPLGSVTTFSADQVKSLLKQAAVGDVLQFDKPRKHSMLVCGVESDGVWIYECNADNRCGVQLTKKSFGFWLGKNSARLSLLRADNYTVTPVYSLSVSVSVDGKNHPDGHKAVTFDVSLGGRLAANDVRVYRNQTLGAGTAYRVHDIRISGCLKLSGPAEISGTLGGNAAVTVPVVTAHTPVAVPGRKPTTERTGLTDGEKCAVCGAILKKQTVIPALPPDPADTGVAAEDPGAGYRVLGDADGNGRINSADARLALRAAARLGTLSEDQQKLADMDADGAVRSADAR